MLEILTKTRYMIGAGGCIFRQYGDRDNEKRIVDGINYIKEIRQSEPFRLIVLSRLDRTTKYLGDWEKG